MKIKRIQDRPRPVHGGEIMSDTGWWRMSEKRYHRKLKDGRLLIVMSDSPRGYWFGEIRCPSGAWISHPGCKDIAEPASTLEDVAGVPHADISKARDAVAEREEAARRMRELRANIEKCLENGK